MPYDTQFLYYRNRQMAKELFDSLIACGIFAKKCAKAASCSTLETISKRAAKCRGKTLNQIERHPEI